MKVFIFSDRQLSSNVFKSRLPETAQQTSPFLDFLVTFCVKTKSKKSDLLGTTSFLRKKTVSVKRLFSQTADNQIHHVLKPPFLPKSVKQK